MLILINTLVDIAESKSPEDAAFRGGTAVVLKLDKWFLVE